MKLHRKEARHKHLLQLFKHEGIIRFRFGKLYTEDDKLEVHVVIP